MNEYTYTQVSEYEIDVHDTDGELIACFRIKPIIYWETSIIINGNPQNRYRAVNPVILDDPEDGGAYVERRELHRGETVIGNIPAPSGSCRVCGTVFASEEDVKAGGDDCLVEDSEAAVFVGRTTPFNEEDYKKWWMRFARMVPISRRWWKS